MKCVLQYHVKKTVCDIKGKQSYNILPHCEIGDKFLSKSVKKNM